MPTPTAPLPVVGEANVTADPKTLAALVEIRALLVALGDYSFLTGTTTWNPASLTNGSSEVKSVTVAGATVGDPAFGGLSTVAATGWVVNAVVIAADTVEVKITNNTGGTVDLASGTVKAVVLS